MLPASDESNRSEPGAYNVLCASSAILFAYTLLPYLGRESIHSALFDSIKSKVNQFVNFVFRHYFIQISNLHRPSSVHYYGRVCDWTKTRTMTTMVMVSSLNDLRMRSFILHFDVDLVGSHINHTK